MELAGAVRLRDSAAQNRASDEAGGIKQLLLCSRCGMEYKERHAKEIACGVSLRPSIIKAAKLGRVAGHSPQARARRSEKQRQHAADLKAWKHSTNRAGSLNKFIVRSFNRASLESQSHLYHQPLASLILAGRKFALADICRIQGTGGGRVATRIG